ncbi:MAG: hypothetical protein ACT4TC_26350 [Myxococcaceae bacterium]
MRTLKLLLAAIALPVLAIVGLGFFLPSQWYAERALMMDVPPTAFAPYLSDTQSWAELGTWSTDGKLAVVSTEPGKVLEFALEGGGWGQLSKGFLAVTPIGKRTRVSLGASGKLLTFLGRYAQPLYEMSVGRDLEEALLVLRQRVHAPEKTEPSSLVVEPDRLADQPPVPPAELEAQHNREEETAPDEESGSQKSRPEEPQNAEGAHPSEPGKPLSSDAAGKARPADTESARPSERSSDESPPSEHDTPAADEASPE